jgi:succinate dehydrogenase hydrophobic anchor subunit
MNFETLMWLFTRLSALAMYVLLLAGVIGALIMGARNQMNLADVLRWAFTSKRHSCAKHKRARSGPLGDTFLENCRQFTVFTAAAHGLHGVLSVLDDYFAQPRVRVLFRVIITILMPVLSAIGIYVHLDFIGRCLNEYSSI